jgi:hypothetical protein
MKFKQIDGRMDLNSDARIVCRLFGLFEQVRCAGVDVTGKQHSAHAPVASAIELFCEPDRIFQAFAAAGVVPIVF